MAQIHWFHLLRVRNWCRAPSCGRVSVLIGYYFIKAPAICVRKQSIKALSNVLTACSQVLLLLQHVAAHILVSCTQPTISPCWLAADSFSTYIPLSVWVVLMKKSLLVSIVLEYVSRTSGDSFEVCWPTHHMTFITAIAWPNANIETKTGPTFPKSQ